MLCLTHSYYVEKKARSGSKWDHICYLAFPDQASLSDIQRCALKAHLHANVLLKEVRLWQEILKKLSAADLTPALGLWVCHYWLCCCCTASPGRHHSSGTEVPSPFSQRWQAKADLTVQGDRSSLHFVYGMFTGDLPHATVCLVGCALVMWGCTVEALCPFLLLWRV